MSVSAWTVRALVLVKSSDIEVEAPVPSSSVAKRACGRNGQVTRAHSRVFTIMLRAMRAHLYSWTADVVLRHAALCVLRVLMAHLKSRRATRPAMTS